MYNICLIGHGYWGEKLARNFNNSEFFKLVSVVDKKNANLNLAKKKYPSIRHYKDYKIAINNSLLDLVIISSPTSTHYKIAKYALENYKHVLVEKPLSCTLNEVKRLNKIANKNKQKTPRKKLAATYDPAEKKRKEQQKLAETLELAIQDKEVEIAKLEGELNEEFTFADRDKMAKFGNAYVRARQELEDLYIEWETATMGLEE